MTVSVSLGRGGGEGGGGVYATLAGSEGWVEGGACSGLYDLLFLYSSFMYIISSVSVTLEHTQCTRHV